MATTFQYDFSPHVGTWKGKSDFSTGLFIGGQFVPGVEGKAITVTNPTTGKEICKVSEGTEKDIDLAVAAAQKAFTESWGLKVPASDRCRLMIKLADLMEANADELAALESLDNGKSFSIARNFDVIHSAETIRYYAGWCDKHMGKTVEVNETKFTYVRYEPLGVVGQIIPWNFPLVMVAWKLGPALATGNAIVLKPSEFTPMTAIRMAHLIQEAGFPPGVVNIVTGYGGVAGAAISSHMGIEKVAFTGSTIVGKTIMKAAAESNLKKVTLELGGKSPNIIFDDADLDQAIKWSAFGIYFNHGQCCCAGSRVYVQEGIYDKFLAQFMEHVKTLQVGDPFHPETFQGPQVSKVQFDRIMGYIEKGKEEGANLLMGGERHGEEGYFIQPTIFTDVKPGMTIVKDEIFGPVVVIIKFKDEKDIVEIANDSVYGLAAAVFSQDISRALTVAHALQAGTVWVNQYNQLHHQVPFGGYKQSGIGRELGEFALHNYTNTKAVHVNLTGKR